MALRYGLAAPAGTPQPIIERLNKELNAALADPEVQAAARQRRRRRAAEPPQAYAADLDREEKKWGALVRKLNLKLE